MAGQVAASQRSHPRGGGLRPTRRLGEILIDERVIDRSTLAEALRLQRATGLRLGELLVARQIVPQQRIVQALAQQWSVGWVDATGARPAPDLLPACDPAACLREVCLPWARIGDTTIIAVADPARGAAAAAACGVAAGRWALTLADADSLRAAIADSFRDALRERALNRSPQALSCRAWARQSRIGGLLVVAGLLGIGFGFGWVALLAGLMSLAVLANLCTSVLRGAALWFSFRPTRPPGLPEDLPRLSRFRRLPVVSLLVPLYREVAVLDPLLAALARIDYPAELLDIRLVLEEDDAPMRNAVAARSLPGHVQALTVPPDSLRTKPRAMNYALDFCRGEIIGIYDAEDQPDPGQITAVVDCLADSPPQVACVQARLGYYNAAENWLSRCFAVEYATWFHVLLPGVQRLGLPVPLGGTSVFFRRAALERVGAWDAHNVTEDADLGIRLARFGFQTRVITSQTLEEANCAAWPWIRQRSRWLKGYMATWISHARNPVGLWRDLGLRGFLGVQVLLLGGVIAYLALPFLWLGLVWHLMAGPPPWVAALPPGVMPAYVGSLVSGQVLMVALSARALAVSGQLRLLPWVLSLPAYWPLGALAAWRAVWELALTPFYWAKTSHGRSLMPGRVPDQGSQAVPSQIGGTASSGKRVASGTRA